jgi:hypothetical protein
VEFEPVKFVDKLISGTILAGYDFVRLSAASVAIPFVRRSRRFWPWLISLTSRISGLTFLLIWVILSISIIVGSPGSVVSNLVEHSSNLSERNGFFTLIFASLIITVVCDLAIRFCCWRQTGVRRRLLETIWRLSIANVFIGATIGDQYAAKFFGPSLDDPRFYLTLCLFSAAAAIAAVKTIRLKRALGKIAAGLVVVLALPALVYQLGLFVLLNASSWATPMLLKEAPKYVPKTIESHDVYCMSNGSAIDVSGYLTAAGYDLLVLHPDDFLVTFNKDDNESETVDLGTSAAEEPDFIVMPGHYAKVVLSIERPKVTELPNGRFPCRLRLLRSGDAFDGDVLQ